MTEIYSPFTSEHRDPAACEHRYREYMLGWNPIGSREQYAALPWAFESLVGSAWINVHTCSIETIISIEPDRFERLLPVTSSVFRLGIGLWWTKKRFCVEHWIRFDVLNTDEQFLWALRKVTRTGEALKCAKDRLERYEREKDSLNIGSSKHDVRRAASEETEAIQALRDFCAANQIATPDLYLPPAQLVQLSLF